ncbi:MAG: phosphatase PAP2 family protein [Bacteroidaceae bacterium]|nr:phosphatase PAP2 family protein [Bacteroidaceae bacterium]MBO4592972.1 phosphatase PAP2 family protein [Bacteroidaceae bacterium]
MKKTISTIALLFLVVFAYGQSNHYLTKEEAPLDTTFIGPPPAFGTLLFEQDFHMYQYGKTLRDTERGKQAIKDADTSTGNLLEVFSEAFGMSLSKERTPEIYKLIATMKEDAGSYATRCTKNTYMRMRPYALYNEPTSVPEDEEGLRYNGSYVSGHSATGVAVSMVLACINPARQNQLYKRGLDFGDSRWIVGFHHYSDVKAGQMVGALVLPALMNNKDFMAQLAKAKAEFARLAR